LRVRNKKLQEFKGILETPWFGGVSPFAVNSWSALRR
jgi:hypothetical protein